MDEKTARERANGVNETAMNLNALAYMLSQAGWYVSAQQVKNAAGMLHDVERRLRNGDDLRG